MTVGSSRILPPGCKEKLRHAYVILGIPSSLCSIPLAPFPFDRSLLCFVFLSFGKVLLWVNSV